MAVDVQQPPPAQEDDSYITQFRRLCELTDQLFQLNQRPIDLRHPSRRLPEVRHVRSTVLHRLITDTLGYMLHGVTVRVPYHRAECEENCNGYTAHHFRSLDSIVYVNASCRVNVRDPNNELGYFLVSSTGFDIYPFTVEQPITLHTPSINFRQFLTSVEQITFAATDAPSVVTHFRPLYERWDALVTWFYSIPNRSIQHLVLDLETVMEIMVEIIYTEAESINQDWHEVRPGIYRPWSQEQLTFLESISALTADDDAAGEYEYEYESEEEDEDEAMVDEMNDVEIS